jgi:WD40 repeat protein
LWDVATGRPGVKLWVSRYGATELKFSPDGAELATGDGVGIHLWDTRSGQELWNRDGENLHFLGFTGAGNDFLIARYRTRHNGAVTILDGATMAVRLDLRLQSHSCGVRLAPDGQRIAVPEGDGSVTVRDASSGAVLARASGLSGRIGDLAFSPGGESLAGCDDAGVICTWDTRTGMRLARFPAASRMLMWIPAVLAAFTWVGAKYCLRRARADGLVGADLSPA